MKIKKVIIEIKPLNKSLGEFAEAFGKVRRNENIKTKYSIGFTNIDSFRKFFSQKRMELLSIIKKIKIYTAISIYNLLKSTFTCFSSFIINPSSSSNATSS